MSTIKRYLEFYKNKFYHKVYGRCYKPIYNTYNEISGEIPKIYNSNGNKMDIFFIRDDHFAHNPYNINDKVPNKYFLWDRYNFALKTHFYTGRVILETMGKPVRKIAWILEPRSIYQKPYDYFKYFKGLHNEFEAVITSDEKILNEIGNAKFIYSYGVWCYLEKGDELKWSENKYQIKNKDISMVVSGKSKTFMHKVRNMVADKVKNQADVFGAYVGKPIKFKSISLDKYRYQIVVENEISAYYFTEKILDCFISQCVPIYFGASNIGQFFNVDGIIQMQIKDIDNIELILKKCNQEDYFSRLSAILDNYYRSLKYLNCDNLMYEEIIRGKGIDYE